MLALVANALCEMALAGQCLWFARKLANQEANSCDHPTQRQLCLPTEGEQFLHPIHWLEPGTSVSAGPANSIVRANESHKRFVDRRDLCHSWLHLGSAHT